MSFLFVTICRLKPKCAHATLSTDIFNIYNIIKKNVGLDLSPFKVAKWPKTLAASTVRKSYPSKWRMLLRRIAVAKDPGPGPMLCHSLLD